MSERGYLGEFELMVILAVAYIGEDAYGVPIVRELERRRGRDVAVGSIYAALDRLEKKGLVTSRWGDPTPERGGKARRYFTVTRLGLRTIRETRKVLSGLWSELPEGERA